MLPEPPPPRRLESDETADWVVLGAGFTGLAVARRLAELRPDDRIVLLEAERVGFGSSGRNSGFVVDAFHWLDAIGREGNAALLTLHRGGRDQLAALVAEHCIDCDWSPIGRYHVAVEPVGLSCLERFKRGLEALGERFVEVPPESLPDRIGTAYYRAAVHTPGTVLTNPAALARGLAAHLPDNVALYEESPVHAIDVGTPHRVECAEGSVTAPRLMLAANGFMPSLGFAERRVLPLMTFASLTRRLDESERARAGAGEWGLVPEENMGTTLRRTRDDRLLVRSRVSYYPSVRVPEARWPRVLDAHRGVLRTRFPDLAGVEIEHTWGGVLGNTMNTGQLFGEIADGVYTSCAYNGVGVALGTASGKALADLAVGRSSPDIDALRELRHPTWMPPNPFLWIGVQSTLVYRRWRAGREL